MCVCVCVCVCRRLKQQMGGSMRQSGIITAGCIYALDHNIERLAVRTEETKSNLSNRHKHTFSNQICGTQAIWSDEV